MDEKLADSMQGLCCDGSNFEFLNTCMMDTYFNIVFNEMFLILGVKRDSALCLGIVDFMLVFFEVRLCI